MSASRHFRQTVCLAMASCLPLAGCGGDGPAPPELYGVTGTVTYKSQPVPGAKVMFMGDGKSPPAVGVTNASGEFELSSMAGTGAAAGKHAVVVVKNTEAKEPEAALTMEEAARAAQNPPEPPAVGSLIPAKYADAATSGLEYEVEPSGSNHFNIELTD